MVSERQQLNDVVQFMNDFLAGAYPQRSALGPGALQKNFFKSKSITSGMIDVSNLEAVSTKTGNLTVDGNVTVGTGGAIKSGLTDYSTDLSNKGYWLGLVAGVPKLLIGGRLTSTTPRIDWDGSALEIIGSIKAESGYLKSLNVYGTLTLGNSTTDGAIAAGKTSYASTTSGFYFDYNSGGSPRVNIGSATAYIQWSGTGLTVKGTINADAGYLDTLSISGTLSFSGAGKINLPGGGSIQSGALDINSATLASVTVDGQMVVGNEILVGTSGYIHSGATSYSSGTGWILEYNGGTPRFRVGTATSGSNYLAFDGTNIEMRGKLKWGATGANYLDSTSSHWELTAGAGIQFLEFRNGSASRYSMVAATYDTVASSGYDGTAIYVQTTGATNNPFLSAYTFNTTGWATIGVGSTYIRAERVGATDSAYIYINGTEYATFTGSIVKLAQKVNFAGVTGVGLGGMTLQGYMPAQLNGVNVWFPYYA